MNHFDCDSLEHKHGTMEGCQNRGLATAHVKGHITARSQQDMPENPTPKAHERKGSQILVVFSAKEILLKRFSKFCFLNTQ